MSRGKRLSGWRVGRGVGYGRDRCPKLRISCSLGGNRILRGRVIWQKGRGGLAFGEEITDGREVKVRKTRRFAGEKEKNKRNINRGEEKEKRWFWERKGGEINLHFGEKAGKFLSHRRTTGRGGGGSGGGEKRQEKKKR